MVVSSASIKLLLLTEDSSKHALPALQSLLSVIVREIVGSLDTRKLVFLPYESEGLNLITNACLWRSQHSKHRHQKIELVRSLATHALMDRTYIVFHFDGDTSWRERASHVTSTQFKQEVLDKVFDLIDSKVGSSGISKSEASNARRSIVTLVPYYSIEAWYYHNLEVLKSLVLTKYHGLGMDTVLRFSGDRSSIEEESKIKDLLPVRTEDFGQLTRRYPFDDAYGAQKSFTAFVDTLIDDTQIIKDLGSDYGSGNGATATI